MGGSKADSVFSRDEYCHVCWYKDGGNGKKKGTGQRSLIEDLLKDRDRQEKEIEEGIK